MDNRADFLGLSNHFTRMASESEAEHVMWLNRFITKKKTEKARLSELLEGFFSFQGVGLKGWIIDRFVKNFFTEPPHPFIAAMQKPDRSVLIGYAMEHHHFLRQWIRSCAYIIAKTDHEDVQSYELENIMTELHGFGSKNPSHHELLIKMGESLGIERVSIIDSKPLPATSQAISTWMQIAENCDWIETMAAMHSLELIATRGLEKYGAKYPYFRPELFNMNDFTQATKDFLREGYEADISHSERALNLVEKYSSENGNVQAIQATFVRSMVAFDSYLNARLERGLIYENKL